MNIKDIIVALAEDYINIYRVRPLEDKVDIIKYDGHVTDGKDQSMDGLSYSNLLSTYIKNRVFSDDQNYFYSKCCTESIIKNLKESNSYSGSYRVYRKRRISYCGFKYIRISAEGEPLTVVAAFNDIDSLINDDMRKMDELEDMRKIMASSEMGIWHITLVKGQSPRMAVDSKMRELLGIPLDIAFSEEEIYSRWFSRIDPKAIDSVNASVQKMIGGVKDENTYKWIHPTLGERYVRCGGTAVKIPDGYMLSGYHYDVTEQINSEIRSNLIIKSFARTYDFLNYIRISNGSYFTYNGSIRNAMNVYSGDVYLAVIEACKTLVGESHLDDMLAFADLSNINARMEHRNVLFNQYKDKNEIWYEWSYVVAERNEDNTIKHLIWAVRRIDDEKQAELRRQKILEDNIAANKTKTMFLQNMSHEIRTPLNAMFGFAQLLGLPDGSWTEEEKSQYNRYIINSFNVLDMLIGDIIDIADAEHGNYRIMIDEVNVNTVCNNALMSAEYRKPAGVNMYFTSEVDNSFTIRSDGRRIQQVLINYLTNACKHTQEGEIHLHCSSTENPGMVTFSVTDTGEGVPENMAEVIFNRFTKLNQFVQGSGLGLNICQMVSSKLGGKVYLDTTYKRGARFVFVLDPNTF